MDESKKIFSEKLYKENDPVSKKMAIEFITEYCPSFRLLDDGSKDKYTHDVCFYVPQRDYELRIEAERKLVWTISGKWQGVIFTHWLTLDVAPRRKYSTAHLHFMFNLHYDTLALTNMRNVKSSSQTPKNTSHTKMENFFNVPRNLFSFYTKKNNKWVRISWDGKENGEVDDIIKFT
jgi:hypothetical protein